MLGLSVIYGAGLKIRVSGYKSGLLESKKLPCKVISVGNITTGGTGKTPMTVYLARRIHQMGYRAAVISRGYRGRAEKSGGIVSNGREIFMGPRLAGDEPFMVATRLKTVEVPVLVGQNRYRIGLLALDKFKPDVIILDDGFQHLHLARDINLVLLDSIRPFSNKYLLPRGLLREPVSSLARADMFILTRSKRGSDILKPETLNIIKSHLKGRQLYKANHVPVLHKWIEANTIPSGNNMSSLHGHDLNALKKRKVFAFSGLANNDGFKHTLEDLQSHVLGFIGFPDHHSYDENDISNIACSASDAGADVLCTTEKDYCRITNKTNWPMDFAVIGVEIAFGDDESNFLAELSLRLLNSSKTHDLSPGE
jgi:tetraacyldisaccharide 4'-kinase